MIFVPFFGGFKMELKPIEFSKFFVEVYCEQTFELLLLSMYNA